MWFPLLVLLPVLLESATAGNRGFILTAPKRLLADSTETVCLSLHNVTGTAHVDIDLLHTDSDEKIASTHNQLREGIGTCLELYVPPTLHTRARLHLQVSFDDLYDYTISSVKEIHIQHEPLLTFIQTDKPIYKPGQEVKFRVLTLRHDLTPVNDPIFKVWVESPSEVRLAQWVDMATQQGLVQLEFQLSHEPQQGIWKIKVERNNTNVVIQSKSFEVREYVLPRFEVSIKPPDFVLADATVLVWTICAKYSYGQPVKGQLHVKAAPQTPTWRQRKAKPPKINFITELKSNDGCFKLNVTGTDLGLPDWDIAPSTIIVSAVVTEVGTDVTQNATSVSPVIHQALKLEFLPHSSQYFKPGLPYTGKVKVLQQNNAPAAGEIVQLCLKVRGKGEWSRTLVMCKNFTSDTNGFVQFLVPPQHRNIVLLSFVATAANYHTKYYSPDKRWRVFMDQPSAFFDVHTWYSPTESYIEIVDSDERSLACNFEHAFHVYFTPQSNATSQMFHYMVKSRGDLIKFGQVHHHITSRNLKIFEGFPNILGSNDDIERSLQSSNTTEKRLDKLTLSLLIEPKLSPLSYLMIYYVKDDGETVATTHAIQVDKCFANKVKAKFLDKQQFPGSESTLHIQAAPHSLCAVTAVDKSTSFLGTSNLLDPDRVFRDLTRFHIDANSLPRQRDTWEYCNKKARGKEDAAADGDESSHVVVVVEPPFWDLRRRRRSIIGGQGSMGMAVVPPSKYVDAIQAFDDFGVIVMSDLTLETRPCNSPLTAGGEHEEISLARIPKRMELDEPDSVLPKGLLAMSPLAYPLTEGEVAIPVGYSEDARLPTTEVRTYFPETWLWELHYVGKDSNIQLRRTLPHTVTDWVTSTVCVSPRLGLGISPPAHVRAFQPFFLDYSMPYSVKRGEVLQLKVALFNFLPNSLPIRITYIDSPGIELLSNSSIAVACVEEHASFVTRFRIKGSILGEINITVSAEVDPLYPGECGPELLINRRDVLVKPIIVEPEGFPVQVTKSSFICPTDFSEDTSVLWNLELPSDVVEDSARAEITVVADLLGPTLQNLDHLVQLPMGCGEQNMILFVPNLHVINYLNATQHINPILRAEAVKNMEKGYQRELNYQHSDGSYSAFGNSDQEGSMWLTAFVVKSFAQARSHIFVDEDDLKVSMRWITKRQLENGCFPLVGQVFHKDMKGGLTGETSSVAVTAYVLISLLETGIPLSPSVASNGVFCLQGDKDPNVYTLVLKTYALALLGETQLAEHALKDLLGVALRQQDLMWWEKPGTLSLGLNIEMTSYAILSLVKLGKEENLIHALKAVRWISKHRNAHGGFVSTQDTIVALEALAKYSTMLPPRETDLTVLVAATDVERAFHITQKDRLVLKVQDVPVLPTQVEIAAEGEGCALIQSSLRYNVKTASGSDAFELEVKTGPVASVDICTVQRLEVCIRYKLTDQTSNMAVLEVAMVTGYVPDRASLHKLAGEPDINLKRWEEERDRVNFYFEELSNKRQCIGFLVMQETEVENPSYATVKLYDYYQQELSVSERYSTDAGCRNERLPHPQPDTADDTTTVAFSEYDDTHHISETSTAAMSGLGLMQSDSNVANITDENSTDVNTTDIPVGLNPQFVNVDHDLETPSGNEGPEEVYVLPQADSEVEFYAEEPTNETSCPSCFTEYPSNFSSIYCNSGTVYKISIRKAGHARLLLDMSPGKSTIRIRKLIALKIDTNCSCRPLEKVGEHVIILDSQTRTIPLDVIETQELTLDGSVHILSIEAHPGQPEKIKQARTLCSE